MTTGGISLGLDQLLTSLFVPGDGVGLTPTYSGSFRTLCDYQLNSVPVPNDEGGLRPDALDQTLARPQGRASRARFVPGADL